MNVRVDIFKWVTELLRSLAAFPPGAHRYAGSGWAGEQERGLCQALAGCVLPLRSHFPFHPAFNPCVCLENKFFIASIL